LLFVARGSALHQDCSIEGGNASGNSDPVEFLSPVGRHRQSVAFFSVAERFGLVARLMGAIRAAPGASP
jgi:hypothetical protein